MNPSLLLHHSQLLRKKVVIKVVVILRRYLETWEPWSLLKFFKNFISVCVCIYICESLNKKIVFGPQN